MSHGSTNEQQYAALNELVKEVGAEVSKLADNHKQLREQHLAQQLMGSQLKSTVQQVRDGKWIEKQRPN